MSFRAAPPLLMAFLWLAGPAIATPFIAPLQTAIAQASAAAEDEAIAAFYRERDFEPVWSASPGTETSGIAARRAAFLRVLDEARVHGLPAARYDPAALRGKFGRASDAASRGALDVEMTERFLGYLRDMRSGVLIPSEVDKSIKIEPVAQDPRADLAAFLADDPAAFLNGLVPRSPAYARLLRQKLRLEETLRDGGWGAAVPDGVLKAGDTGPAVVALRERLARMGYLRRSVTATYDATISAAVSAFQTDHGLGVDGEAGPDTLRAINVPLEDRLVQIVVGLERQRWMNRPLEARHVLVNLAEQRAYVVDEGIVTFDTVVVIGSDTPDRRTPEFSDTMSHLVVNPTWNVPRSIAVNEYLPALRRGGARHLTLYRNGDRVDPARVDFSRYTASTFPFRLKQAPGPTNALGRVKFMFPNRWNIYLHDTPSRDLFAREVRTFSHGCVRVGRPLELAYHLLAPQTATPQDDFTRILDTGRERRVDLEPSIGVHIVYWSAWVTPMGRANFRGDPYGRDAKVWQALREAGVELGPSRS